MKKFLLSAVLTASATLLFSQSATVVTNGTNCIVSHNFNNSSEGFSSPSIYSDNNDVAFNWNAVNGNELESSGLVVRTASLISPVFILSGSGQTKVGFSYNVPIGTQYRVRIISAITSSPLEILANTANGPVYTALSGTSGSICLVLTDANLTSGRMIRFEFTFRALLPGNMIFDNLAVGVAGGALPVTFEGFVARQNADGSIKLLWNVGEEVNVEGYEVETSTNGVSFKSAGHVKATGTAIYGMDFPEKQLQTMYYRVRNIDYDGKSKYSTIIRVYTKEQTTDQIQIYPLPAVNMVTVQHKRSSTNAMIRVYSQSGSLIQEVRPALNSLQTQIQIDKLMKGMYILRYDDGAGTIKSTKLVKN